MQIQYTNASTISAGEVARHIQLIRSWMTNRDHIFDCDCDAYQESDTGAWIHSDQCSSGMVDHCEIVLESLQKYFATLAGEQ